MMLTERPFDTGSIRLNLAEGPDAGPPMVLLHGASARRQGLRSEASWQDAREATREGVVGGYLTLT
jgi:hypothetical protein